MKVNMNGQQVGKDELMQLLSAFEHNHQKSWMDQSKVSLTADDKKLFEKLNKSHRQLMAEQAQLKVWEKLQLQRLEQGALRGDNPEELDRIRQLMTIQSERLLFRFCLRSKTCIGNFLKKSFNNPRMFSSHNRYSSYDDTCGTRYQFRGTWSLGYRTLQSLSMVPDLIGEEGYYCFFPLTDSEYESEAHEWNLDASPWDKTLQGVDMKRAHADRCRQIFASHSLQSWQRLSPKTSSAFHFHSSVERIKGTLFYELQMYINQRQRIQQANGSDYYRLGFWGQSASDKLRAAHKLQLLCDKNGRLNPKGMLSLTSNEAQALITGSLGRLCARYWCGSHAAVPSLLELLKANNIPGETTIDLENATLIAVVDVQQLTGFEPVHVAEIQENACGNSNAVPAIPAASEIAIAVPVVAPVELLPLGQTIAVL